MPAQDLSEKVAIVTGGAHGIGLATARLLTERGAAVVIADLKDDLGEKAAEELRRNGRNALFVRTDVSNSRDATALLDASMSQFGGVDILINNAGVIRLNPILKVSEAEWDLIINVNLKGTFLCAQAFAPQIAKRGGGSIVNTASPVFQRALAECGAYIAAKGGV